MMLESFRWTGLKRNCRLRWWFAWTRLGGVLSKCSVERLDLVNSGSLTNLLPCWKTVFDSCLICGLTWWGDISKRMRRNLRKKWRAFLQLCIGKMLNAKTSFRNDRENLRMDTVLSIRDDPVRKDRNWALIEPESLLWCSPGLSAGSHPVFHVHLASHRHHE